MVVYLDALFLLNLIVDYLLLRTSARLAGEPLHRLRLAGGGFLGAAYAAALFLPGLGWLGHPACRVGAAVLMVLCAFGGSRRLVRLTLVFFGVSAAFAGVILALQLLGQGGLSLENGVVYTGFDARLLLVSAVLCCAGLSLVFGRTARHGGTRRDLAAVRLTLGERSVQLTALVDTGNTLTDPADGRPVMVAEGRALAPLLPPGADPADPVGSMERLGRCGLRLLPYRAVGVESGLLLAIRVDRAVIGGHSQRGLLVAVSPTPVSDGGGYQALIGQLEEWEADKHELEPALVPESAAAAGAPGPGRAREDHVHRGQRYPAAPTQTGGGGSLHRPAGRGG